MALVLETLKKNVKNLNFNEIIEEAVTNTDKKAADLQRKQMLYGEASDDKKIGKYASEAYAAEKYKMNKKAGRGNKDLKLTGSFHRFILVDPRKTYVVFSSADEKLAEILKREGARIFGLNTPYTVEYVSKYLGPEIQTIINNELSKL